MAMTMHVDIVSAEAEIYSGRATMVFAPAVMGEVGILPRHTPLLTKIRPGEVRIRTEGGTEESFYVSGGMLEVQPHVVTILATPAARAKDLDDANAVAAKQALAGKVVARVERYRNSEMLIEFADGTRLFVDGTADGVERSVTGGPVE